jgi:hypothetical protein
VADRQVVDVEIELSGKSLGGSARHTEIEARAESHVSADSVTNQRTQSWSKSTPHSGWNW